MKPSSLTISVVLISVVYLAANANQSNEDNCDAYTGATQEIPLPQKRVRSERSSKKRHDKHVDIKEDVENKGNSMTIDSTKLKCCKSDTIKSPVKK